MNSFETNGDFKSRFTLGKDEPEMTDEEIKQANLADTLERERIFENVYNSGEVGTDPHFIACAQCGEALECLPTYGTGVCSRCGTVHYLSEGIYRPSLLRMAI